MQGAVKDAEAKKGMAPDLPDAGFHRSGIQRVYDDRLDANVSSVPTQKPAIAPARISHAG
jgi:hypothetical protein